MQLNARTQIHRRHTVLDISKVTEKDVEPPNIDALSQIFRKDGVDLAVSACTKAMEEAKASASEITHVVAVTCTDQGNPGFDLLVCQKLGLPPSVQRTLLHGVGCAGGLSALRAAADTAAASSQKSQPACVLVIACELCSLFLQAELQAASQDDALHIAPALFSDAAAALVVCNKLAIREGRTPIYELQGWSSMLVPDTVEHMSYEIKPQGTSSYSPYDGPETDNLCRLDSYYHGPSPQDRHRRDIAHLCPPRCRLYSS
jgi:type III polyketide synthase